MNLSHSDCRSDFGRYREAIQKTFDQLEQISKCIVTGTIILDRLIHLDVTRIRAYRLKKGTYREKNSEANVYRIGRREWLYNECQSQSCEILSRAFRTYQAEVDNVRKCIKNRDSVLE